MLCLVATCVDVGKNKFAREGLIQYRSCCQSANMMSSLETVIRKFLSLAEGRAKVAQNTANQSVLDTLEDLEEESPESIMLTAISGEGTKDRTERELLTPWLKFLWEAYRLVLEVLRNNNKLENLYQETAQHAFQFCQRYKRTTEFKRLCELLRTHLSNMSYPKYAGVAPVNLNSADSLHLALETRFQQLQVATELDLWQEAYRSLEDIHGLLSMSRKVATPSQLAQYYHYLSSLFWVGENYILNAHARYRLYNVTKMHKKDADKDDLAVLASSVLLAAMVMPIKDRRQESLDATAAAAAVAAATAAATGTAAANPNAAGGGNADSQADVRDKYTRMAGLLAFNAISSPAATSKNAPDAGAAVAAAAAAGGVVAAAINTAGGAAGASGRDAAVAARSVPTIRELFISLLAAAKQMQSHAVPELRELFDILETEFSPLEISGKMKTIFTFLQTQPKLSIYLLPLQRVTITRIVMQLARLYQTFLIAEFVKLVDFMPWIDVERVVMDAVQHGLVHLHVDHLRGILNFQNLALEADTTRSQLAVFSRSMADVAGMVRLASAGAAAAPRPQQGESQGDGLLARLTAEHERVIQRRTMIEERKRAEEDKQLEKERAAREIEQATQRQREEQEAKRMAVEMIKREEEAKKTELDYIERVQVEQLQVELEQTLGKKINIDEEFKGLSGAELRSRIMQKQAEKVQKERSDMDKKISRRARDIDYLERAMREVEAPLLQRQAVVTEENDNKMHEEKEGRKRSDLRADHERDLKAREVLVVIASDKTAFIQEVIARRQEKAQLAEEERKVAERVEAERKKKELEELEVRKLAAEKIAKEREAERERERLERQAVREKEEAARKQDERGWRDKEPAATTASAPSTSSSATATATTTKSGFGSAAPVEGSWRAAAPAAAAAAMGPPLVPVKQGGWREREAAKRAAEGKK